MAKNNHKKIKYTKTQIQLITEFKKILAKTKRTPHLEVAEGQLMLDCYSEYFNVKIKRIEYYSSTELFSIYAKIKDLVKEYDENMKNKS